MFGHGLNIAGEQWVNKLSTSKSPNNSQSIAMIQDKSTNKDRRCG